VCHLRGARDVKCSWRRHKTLKSFALDKAVFVETRSCEVSTPAVAHAVEPGFVPW
jgi:hypothetical protein